MYRPVLKAQAPVILGVFVVATCAAALVTFAASAAGVPEDGIPATIFQLARSGGFAALLSVALQRLLLALGEAARVELSQATGSWEWIPSEPDKAIMAHWRYRRSDEVTKEIFAVLVEDAPTGTPPKRLLQAARTLAEESR